MKTGFNHLKQVFFIFLKNALVPSNSIRSRVIFPEGGHYEGVVRVRLVESVGRIFLGKPTKCTAAKAICSSGKAAVTYLNYTELPVNVCLIQL